MAKLTCTDHRREIKRSFIIKAARETKCETCGELLSVSVINESIRILRVMFACSNCNTVKIENKKILISK